MSASKLFRNCATALALLATIAAARVEAQSVGANASLPVTTASSNVALPVNPTGSVIVAPAAGTTAEIFYALGSASVAATLNSKSLPSGGICITNVGPATNIAAIVATGTANLRITQITGGCPTFAGAGGGSGGGSVTQGTSPWVVAGQGTAGSPATGVVTVQGIAGGTNIPINEAQINGVAPLMGNGVSGTGSQRVNIASDNTPFLVNGAQGGAALSVTNGWYTNILQGNAVLGTGNPLFAQITAGAALIGKVGIDQTTPGTTNNVTTDGVADAVTSSASVSSAATGATFASTAGYGSITFQITANASGNTVVWEGSNDGSTWAQIALRNVSNSSSSGGQNATINATSGTYELTTVMPQMRWRVSTFVGGTTTIATGFKRSQTPNIIEAFVGNTVAVAPTVSGDIIVTPSANFTRPANTTAYAAGQLVANSTTAGSVVPLSWTATRINAGNAYVRRARMTLSSKSITNTSFVLHLYTVTPATITNGDGGAWLTTLANMFCDLNVTVTDVGADVSQGIGTPASGSECNFVAAGGSQTIYGLLSAAAAYTPASAEVITVVPEIHQN